jgi:hypothetical protein
MMGTNVEPYLAQLGDEDRAALARGIEVMRQLMTLPSPEQQAQDRTTPGG